MNSNTNISTQRQLFVINGFPGSGKTTFGTLVGEELERHNVHFLHTSSIDPIKHVLMPRSKWNPSIINPSLWDTIDECKRVITDQDWDGMTKDVYWRGVMSAMKQKLNDTIPTLVQDYIFRQVASILTPAVVFVDIREPENIDALKDYVLTMNNPFPVAAVLIESDVMAQFDNSSDARVLEYSYDVVIDNRRSSGGTLEKLRQQVRTFCLEEVLSIKT